MLRNYSSLATFPSLIVKVHVHSVGSVENAGPNLEYRPSENEFSSLLTTKKLWRGYLIIIIIIITNGHLYKATYKKNSVRENVRNNSKKRKKSCFYGF